jgi:hypothetical protein
MAKIHGLAALKNNFRAVSEAPTGKELDVMLSESLIPLRDETNARAPRPSLRSGAVIAKVAGSGRTKREFWVAFRRGLPMRIAHLVELGTAPHSLARGASRRKNIMQDVPPFHPGTPAEPFFRPAFEATHRDVVNELARRMWQRATSVIRGVKQ